MTEETKKQLIADAEEMFSDMPELLSEWKKDFAFMCGEIWEENGRTHSIGSQAH